MGKCLCCHHCIQKIFYRCELDIHHFLQDLLHFFCHTAIQQCTYRTFQGRIARMDDPVPFHVRVHADSDRGFFGHVFSKSARHIESFQFRKFDPGLPQHDRHHRVCRRFCPDKFFDVTLVKIQLRCIVHRQHPVFLHDPPAFLRL